MLPFVVPTRLAPPVLSSDVGGWRVLTKDFGTFRVRPMRRRGDNVVATAPLASRVFALGLHGEEPVATTSSTGRTVTFSLDRDPGLDLLVADGRTLATRRKVRIGIDAVPSWSPEDDFIVLTKSYGWGVGHLSLLDSKTGGVRRVSDDASFVWWAAPRRAILLGTPRQRNDPVVTRVSSRFVTTYGGVYGVPSDLGAASLGKIVTAGGVLYSRQGRYGAYAPMSEIAGIPGLEGERDEVWTKARGKWGYAPALSSESASVVSVWTSPRRILVVSTETSAPILAIQALEEGVARYRVTGLRGGESIVGFVHE